MKKPQTEVVLVDPIQVNIVDQNKSDLDAYAEEVVTNRAVVDIYGFKPVHRLLLYCAFAKTGMTGKKTIKSARLVGDVIGLFHAHGDISTYTSISTLLNWYDCYIPLFKKQGNWGSYQGDEPAAMRYTECTLSPFALDCVIGDLRESPAVVDWTRNYDNTTVQPVFLPVKLPLLLINGTDGIAVGMKADIPTHNINEVINATIQVIDNPDAPVVLIPDHCMSCEIVDTNWKAISNSGRGNYTVRSIINLGEYEGYPALFIKSLPNKTRLDPIKKNIEELKFTDLPQILGVYEDCTPTDMTCIVKFRRGTDLNYAKQILYKKTNLQKTFRVNFQVYDPRCHRLIPLSYKAYIQFFIEFRKSTLFRLYSSKYQECITKIHALDMYVTLSKHKDLDKIIAFIRKNISWSDSELIEELIQQFNLTDLQSTFLIHNDISKISPYHTDIYEKQLNELKQSADTYYSKLVNEDELTKDIREELLRIKKQYGSPRRCKIITENEVAGIPEGRFKIVITERNYICKIDANRNGVPNFKQDKPKYMLIAENTDNLLIFDNQGKIYKLPVNSITLHDNRSNGLDIRVLIKALTSDIVTIITESSLVEYSKRINPSFYLVCLSRNGYCKKVVLDELLSVSLKGTPYMKVDPDDAVQDITIAPENIDLIVYSHSRAIRYPIQDVATLKRTARGYLSIKADYTDGLAVITGRATHVLVITDNGYINKFKVEGFPTTTRGLNGSKIIKLHQGDNIKLVFGVTNYDKIRVVTDQTDTTINISDIAEGSSISPGQKVIPTREIVLRAGIIKH